ncbi:hypothetical protein ACGFZJ_14910 [Streptomyces sp. NPDC048253]
MKFTTTEMIWTIVQTVTLKVSMAMSVRQYRSSEFIGIPLGM